MSVTVLCPNGRRVNVKVTPNTSILQIIEDACNKEKFDPDEYDLKHLHRTLDTSNSVRYSNIPNKSQLELVKCAVPRTASNVTVNIASDAGQRLVEDFPPNTTLWEILSHHEEKGKEGTLIPPEGGDSEPVVVYAMRRIMGSQLKTTTLKSLGLTRGKCMLRHSIQKSSTSGQAHVSAPLSRPKPLKEDSNAQSKQVASSDLVPNVVQEPEQVVPQAPRLVMPIQQRRDDPVMPTQQRRDDPVMPTQRRRDDPAPPPIHCPPEPEPNILLNHHGPPADIATSEHPDVINSARDSVPDVIQAQNGVLQPDIVADKGGHSHPPPMPMDILEGHSSTSSSSFVPESELMQIEENVIKLGSHDAILFNMEDAPPVDLSVDDDTFFQLTVDEIKSLHREHQKALHGYDDAPLMTKQMREMEESAKTLAAMNQFPVTQLRIYFPDNNVIQGSFKPTETVAVVMDFLRPYLSNPNAEFGLYMRHPQRILSPETTLVVAECVPNARLYFSSSSSSPYLSEETLSKKSSFRSACSTLKSRGTRRPMSMLSSSYESGGGAGPSFAVGVASNVSNSEIGGFPKRTNTNMHATGAVKKVPKWFKTGK